MFSTAIAVVASWIPPLPIVNEARALVVFITSSADDLAEDLLKLVSLISLYRTSSKAISLLGIAVDSLAHVTLLVCCIIAMFPIVDYWADLLASAVQPWQNAFAQWLEVKSSDSATRRSLKPYDGDVIDEYVEDVVKTLCLGAHVSVGSAVSDIIVPASVTGSSFAPLRAFGMVAKIIVAVGTPASQYAECDDYADRLGDALGGAMPVVPAAQRFWFQLRARTTMPQINEATLWGLGVLILGIALTMLGSCCAYNAPKRLGCCLMVGAVVPLAEQILRQLGGLLS